MRLILLLVVFFAAGAALAADKPIRFWNLTMQTVTSLQLAKAGTTDFGPDFCKSDKDGEVDHDERLNLPKGTRDGRWNILSASSQVEPKNSCQ